MPPCLQASTLFNKSLTTLSEILRGDSDQDPSVDMWALGILALHLACRNQGLDPTIAHTISNPPTPSQSEIDALLRRLSRGSNAFAKATYDFVAACLRVDPRRRIRADDAVRHPLLTYNDGVFRALEELRNRGCGADGGSPLVEMGRELRDVAPDWKIGMKGIPPPRSDSAAQHFGTVRGGLAVREYARDHFPAPATLRAKAGSHRDPASPFTPRTPADEPQNPFRMSPLVQHAATLRGPQVSPTRGSQNQYISPHAERTLPVHNPRPRRAPVWSVFNQNPPTHNPNPEAEGPVPQAEAEDVAMAGEGRAPSFGAFGRGTAPTDPGPWERDVRGRGTPYPRFHRD